MNPFPWQKFYFKEIDDQEYDLRLFSTEVIENCILDAGRFRERRGFRHFYFDEINEVRLSWPTSDEFSHD